MAAGSSSVRSVLRENHNVRALWIGQIVSDIGDHFNTIAVFSLAMDKAHSGGMIAAIMIARAVAAVAAAPIAGIVLDRIDRRRTMIASDLVRAVIALCFLFSVGREGHGELLLILSAALMLASPFFTAGRSSILPALTPKDDLHAVNSLIQTTQWTNTAVGAALGGVVTAGLGFHAAFIFNSISFLISAGCVYLLREDHGEFRAKREGRKTSPITDLRQGLAYMRANPLILGIALVSIGWATGGGAAQILFGVFGHSTFQGGALGIGTLWGSAGMGLIAGGFIAHRLGRWLNFDQYKMTISICYLVHGLFYVFTAMAPAFAWAMLFVFISRVGTAISSVLNSAKLLSNVDQAYRGRVFSTIETATWSTMLISMAATGWALEHFDPRWIGVAAGILSSTTALSWGYLNWSGRLPEPESYENGAEERTLAS